MALNRRQFLTLASSVAAAAPFISFRDVLARPSFNTFEELRGGVGTYVNQGGTIGWYLSDDALVVVDTQFPEAAQQCWAGLQERTSRRIDILINTHHHGDHTAGNSVLGAQADMILAHENVPTLQRQAAERSGNTEGQVYATSTYGDMITHDVGGERVTLRYYGPAHTGGDSVIHFENADVAHMGDLVFNRRPPFIDIGGGASTRNWIELLQQVHDDFTDETLFIFGHARDGFAITGTRSDLVVMRDFLGGLVTFVQQGIQDGKSVDELSETQQLPDFPDHFIESSPNSLARSIQAVHQELTQEG